MYMIVNYLNGLLRDQHVNNCHSEEGISPTWESHTAKYRFV